MYSQTVQPLTTFPSLLNCWPPKTLQMPPRDIVGRIVLAYVHSKINTQACTKFGANRSSRLATFPDLNLWPHTNAPAVLRGELYLAYVMSITRRIRKPVPKLAPIGPAVWQLPILLNWWPPEPPSRNAPWCIDGRIVFNLCPFPDESADVYQIWCQSVQPFDSFPRLLNVWPPTTPPPPEMPPGVLWGEMDLAYVHFQTNTPTYTKFGANRRSRLTATTYFWICDPLTPPPPEMPPGYCGAVCI